MPNAFEFYQSGGCPGLKNEFSKKNFYRLKKIVSKSPFKHKKILMRPPRGSLEALKVVPVLTPHPVYITLHISFEALTKGIFVVGYLF